MEFIIINIIYISILLIDFVKLSPIKKTTTFDDNVFPNEECLSSECSEISNKIINSLNTDIDPCNDFYEFACGNWIRDHKLQEGQDEISKYSQEYENNIEQLHSILEGNYKQNKNYNLKEKKYDKDVFNKLKNIYSTCIDINAIKKKNNKPILDLLTELKIYENKKLYSTINGLTKLIISLHNHSIPFLFDIYTSITDSDIFQLSINENNLSNSYKNKEVDFFDANYKNYVSDTLKLVLEGKKNINIMAMTNAIVNFENELSTIHYKVKNKRSMTIGELKEKCDFIDWKEYFTNLFTVHKINEKVTLETVIFNNSPEYFENLADVILKFSVEELAYYAEWNVIKQYTKYLSDKYIKPYEDFKLKYFGISPVEKTRVEFCDEKIDEIMGVPLSKFLGDSTYDENIIEEANLLILYLKQGMINLIPELTWLDDETKNGANKKVMSMIYRIGLTNDLKDPIQLYEKYENLKTSTTDYFTNMVNYEFYSLNKKIKLYKTKYVDEKWFFNARSINPSYEITDNSLNFPVGIFKKSNDLILNPDYINFGSASMVISHELVHAFDSNGRYFDYNHNSKDWWSQKSSKNYDELSQCLYDQYSKFYITDENNSKYFVDGYETLNENLADNIGVASAFEAWKISILSSLEYDPSIIKERNPLLPNLSNYTFEQLFYISFAQKFCSNTSTKYDINFISKNEKSPPKYRVNGVVMNSEHFSKVFNCPRNSPMNPINKCLVI